MIEVPSLPEFVEADWESIAAAFENAPSLPFGQAWRETPQEKLRAGTVKVGRVGKELAVFSNLTDDKIFTLATGNNQPLWTLGDVFEIFLRDSEKEEYVELHLAPSGHRLQLRFASPQTIFDCRDGKLTLESCMVEESILTSQVREVEGGWQVFARVPAATLGLGEEPLAGRTVFASFGRYDYEDSSVAPVLSSTSPHAELNYHRLHEWLPLHIA